MEPVVIGSSLGNALISSSANEKNKKDGIIGEICFKSLIHGLIGEIREPPPPPFVKRPKVNFRHAYGDDGYDDNYSTGIDWMLK